LFYHYLGPLAFAGSKNDGVLGHAVRVGATAAVGIALEAEFSWTKFRAQQQYRCGADNRQRNQLLPIHGRKII